MVFCLLGSVPRKAIRSPLNHSRATDGSPFLSLPDLPFPEERQKAQRTNAPPQTCLTVNGRDTVAGFLVARLASQQAPIL